MSIKESTASSWSLARAVIGAAAVTMLLISHAYADQPAVPSNPEPSRTNNFLFFPYQDCILCTIEELNVEKAPSDKNSGVFVVKAEIKQVLQGRCKEGEHITIHFENPPAGFFPSKPPNELKGAPCVWAFDHIVLQGDGLRGYNLYAPFAAQNFKPSDIEQLRQNLACNLHSDSCIQCRIKAIRKYPADPNAEFALIADVQSVLLGDGFKPGETIEFVVKRPSCDDDVFKGRCSIPACGEQVLGFTFIGSLDDRRYITNVRTLNSEKNVSQSDLQVLKAKLHSQTEQLESALHRYLEHRWTVNRLAAFCRPDTRSLAEWSLVPRDYQMLHFSRVKSEKWAIHPEAAAQLGKVSWYAAIESGVPLKYEVEIVKGKDYWLAEIACPSLIQSGDDEFVRNIVYTSLQKSMSRFVGVHWQDIGYSWEKGWTQIESADRVERDSKGDIERVICTQSDGKRITVETDNNLRIRTILVDGRSDELWNRANKEALVNYDKTLKLNFPDGTFP